MFFSLREAPPNRKRIPRFRLRAFLIRLASWEYWPAQLTNLPVVAFWLFFAVRARNLFFFADANPAIETGGLFGESKMDILNQVPAAYKPRTLFVVAGLELDALIKRLENEGYAFPLILKPNVGERGTGVEKVRSISELALYYKRSSADLIIQEFVSLPEEYSLLYYRFPGESTGAISSFCKKEFLTVEGDGIRTLDKLVKAHPRAYLQYRKLDEQHDLDRIPAAGEEVLLVPIGNHARGAKFLNANAEIDDRLVTVFDRLSAELDGIFVGRFDFKAESLELLKQGKNFHILEINGVAGEPAHIYDPAYPLWKAYRDLFLHWRMVFKVSQAVKREGVPLMNFREAWSRLWAHVRYLKQFS